MAVALPPFVALDADLNRAGKPWLEETLRATVTASKGTLHAAPAPGVRITTSAGRRVAFEGTPAAVSAALSSAVTYLLPSDADDASDPSSGQSSSGQSTTRSTTSSTTSSAKSLGLSLGLADELVVAVTDSGGLGANATVGVLAAPEPPLLKLEMTAAASARARAPGLWALTEGGQLPLEGMVRFGSSVQTILTFKHTTQSLMPWRESVGNPNISCRSI